MSLAKARLLISWIVTRSYTLAATLVFFCIDVALSYLLPLILAIALPFVMYGVTGHIPRFVGEWVRLVPLTDYLFHHSENIHIITVTVPTTLLTSTWTFLLFISGIVAKALFPLQSLGRFTAFWFRDMAKRPLTAIAKVMGALLVIFVLAINGVRWIIQGPAP